MHQPVDLTRHEATLDPAQSLDHWRRIAARLPKDIYAGRRTGARRSFAASFTVPSLLATARAIASEHKVWPSAVHLAAYAITVAAYTGKPRVGSGCTPASGNPAATRTCWLRLPTRRWW